jgi:hypothetical protein
MNQGTLHRLLARGHLLRNSVPPLAQEELPEPDTGSQKSTLIDSDDLIVMRIFSRL